MTTFIAIPSTKRSLSLSHEVVIGVASSVSVFILSSVLFLTIGLVCGCYCGQKWKKFVDKVTKKKSALPQPNPLYEDVVIPVQDVELKENAAYSSVSQFNK